MNLELKHLAPYLPYGLQMTFSLPNNPNQTGRLLALGTTLDNTLTAHVQLSDTETRQIRFGKDTKKSLCKPILRPLSDLKSFMPLLLQELSKLDLSGCTFEENEFEEDINQWWVNAFDGDRVIASLTFDTNAFYIQYWHGNADDSFQLYEPQYVALNELTKHHFDYQYLIDAGLAIDINTL